MFQGASALNLDAKGRLAVPTRYRDALNTSDDGKMTVTRHPDGCLMLFPRSEWALFRERINALPIDAQWWKRLFLGNAVDVELDSASRILISPELRKQTGIVREVTLLGMGCNLELWDSVTYEAKEAQALKQPMPDIFKNFSF